jgi:hypothetical protein
MRQQYRESIGTPKEHDLMTVNCASDDRRPSIFDDGFEECGEPGEHLSRPLPPSVSAEETAWQQEIAESAKAVRADVERALAGELDEWHLEWRIELSEQPDEGKE